jgi:NTE family protein
LDFTSDRARKNLKMGYFDVHRVFRKLKGKKYYVEPVGNDDIFINHLVNMEEWKIKKVCELFGMERHSGKRVIFEHLVPKVVDLLGLSPESSYEDVAIGLLERAAEKMDIERFKIYTFEEFFGMIYGRYKFEEDGFTKEIPGFLRSNELLSRLVREKILSGIASILFGSG